MKSFMIAAAVAATMTPAIASAGVFIHSQEAVYATVNHYETVEVCTRSDDKTTEGAIIGGLLGSKDGNAGAGALIGAILGDLAGEKRCTTERRISHTTQELTGYRVTLNVDGKLVTLTVDK